MKDFSKVITFLNALETGLEIDVDGRTFALGFDSDDNPRISHKVKTENTITGEIGYQYIEGIDLHDINEFFLYLSNKLSDDDILKLNANISLNKLKKNAT